MLSLASAGHLYPRSGAGDRQQASDESLPRYLVVRRGDLVINPMWLTGGSLAVSDRDGAVSPDYRVFGPTTSVWPRFLHHLLRSEPYRRQYDLYIRANTTFDRRIQQIDLDNMPISIPDLAQQRRIAQFLDDQVSRIDNIVAARGAQIERVQQYRDEVIRRCVGGGMPVETADLSALGRGPIPRGWLLSRVSMLVRLKSGEAIDSEDIGDVGPVPVYGANGLRGYSTSSTHSGLHCLIGRQGALCGNVQVVRGEFWASEHAIVCSPIAEFNTQWFAWLLRSMNLGQHSMAAAQPGISASTVARLRIPVPPPSAQSAIGREVESLELASAERVTNLRRSAQLLTEYKHSLVTAAVTGQFDVTTASTEVPA